MREVNSLEFIDFVFGNNSLSDFEGEIAGISSGYPTFGIKPSLDIKSEKISGRHGEIVYGATYQPRTIDIPVLFRNLDYIRDISAWLGALQPQKLYFADDSIYCYAMLDSNSVDLDNIGMIDGNLGGIQILKFICHNPFYYNLYENKTTISSGLSSFSFYNDGNFESLPNIKINVSGTQNVTFGINGNVFTINNVVGNVYINSEYMTVSTGSTNMINNFVGDFSKFVFKAGSNHLSVTNAVSVEIEPKSRFI